VVVVETDSIDSSVGNVGNYVNCGIEHVDALGAGGSFDYGCGCGCGSLIDLGRDPSLLSAFIFRRLVAFTPSDPFGRYLVPPP
jgi:hypothetical protein